jgi:hypothetical protein
LVTAKVELIVAALETSSVELKEVPLVTAKVELIVAALETDNVELNVVDFLTYRLPFNDESPETLISPFNDKSSLTITV